MKTKQGKEVSKKAQEAMSVLIKTVAEVAAWEYMDVDVSINEFVSGGYSFTIYLNGRQMNYSILKSGQVKSMGVQFTK